MLGARVPEATIDEHSDAPSTEDDVGAHAQALGPNEEVLSESMSPPMQLRPQANLRSCVRTAVGLADLGGCIARGHGIRHQDTAAEVDGSLSSVRTLVVGGAVDPCHTPQVYWPHDFGTEQRGSDIGGARRGRVKRAD